MKATVILVAVAVNIMCSAELAYGHRVQELGRHDDADTDISTTGVPNMPAVRRLKGTKAKKGKNDKKDKKDQKSSSSADDLVDQEAQQLKLSKVLLAVESNTFTNATTRPLLSVDPEFYTSDITTDNTQPPSVRAMSWILNEDSATPTDDPWLVVRYALATIYFSLAGEAWITQDNWLNTDVHACEWHGVSCDRLLNDTVQEIDLPNNNLVGNSIPVEFSMLSELRSIVLTNNKISGIIPSDMFGQMESLFAIFLDNNLLHGELQDLESLRDNGILSVLFIQHNNITGRWPRNFCPRTGQDPFFTAFGLDCTVLSRCLCCTTTNCF